MGSPATPYLQVEFWDPLYISGTRNSWS